MAEQPISTECTLYNDVYQTNLLGGQGEEYSRLIAIWLLTKATLSSQPFKLALEFSAGDKFDDVAFYHETAKEWWLIQAKHSIEAKEVTKEAMLSPTGDFSMVKYFNSFLNILQNWQYGGKKVRLFLLTNRRLHSSISTKKAVVDELMQFSAGKYFQLLPKPDDMEVITYHIHKEICDCFVKLFIKKHSKVIHKLLKHQKLVSYVLTKEENCVKFSENFLNNKPKSEFYQMMKSAFDKTDMSKLALEVPADFPNFWSDSSHQISEPFKYSDSIRAFFNDLVLAVSQPNVRQLFKDLQNDWQNWMKTRIYPDVFRKLTEAQLQEPFYTFRKHFDFWEKSYEMMKTRLFLTDKQSAQYLNIAKTELALYAKYYGRQDYVGLDAAENYYVKRWITYQKLQNPRDSSSNAKSGEKISAEYFTQRLCTKWSQRPQCFILFAEPGMGKTTLWQHLSFCAQQNYKDVAVFLIFLNDFKKNLRNIDENTDARDAVKIMKSVISKNNYEFLLNMQQKTVIFLDAFDELEEKNKKPILNFVNIFMKRKNNIKFVISSRERCIKELTNLCQYRIEVIPFDVYNRREFLRLFWRADETTKFNEYSSELLRKFERGVPTNDISFIGLPLTMKMLAEIFHNSFLEYMNSTANIEMELSNISIDVIYLYEQFVRKSMLLTLNKKLKLNIKDPSVRFFLNQNIDVTELKYQLLAMTQMGLDQLIDERHIDVLEGFHKSICEGQEESLLLETINKINRFRPKPYSEGLEEILHPVTIIKSSRFLHRSYAEYLCAKYIFSRIETADLSGMDRKSKLFFINNKEFHKLESTFTNEVILRKFYFKILAKTLSENNATVIRHLEILKKMWKVVELWANDNNCEELVSNIKNVNELRSSNGVKTLLLNIAARSEPFESVKVIHANSSTATPPTQARNQGGCIMIKKKERKIFGMPSPNENSGYGPASTNNGVGNTLSDTSSVNDENNGPMTRACSPVGEKKMKEKKIFSLSSPNVNPVYDPTPSNIGVGNILLGRLGTSCVNILVNAPQ